VGGRRALGLGLALLIEALLVLLLLTLDREEPLGVKEERPTVVTFIAPEEAPEARRSEPEQRAEERPETQQPEPEEPRPPQPAEPAATPAAPAAPAILPMRWSLSPPNPFRNSDRPAPPARPPYGPPDNRSAAMRDTERVGTAPNGEPLYAAQWYREPDDDMLLGADRLSHGAGLSRGGLRRAQRISGRIADQSLSARRGVGIQGATSATGRTATGGLLGQDQNRLRPRAALAKVLQPDLHVPRRD